MTAAEKQQIARFIDLAYDRFQSGYKNAEREYQFDDDANQTTECYSGPEDSEYLNPFEQIASEIRRCRGCPLCKARRNTVPGEGVSQPQVLVIGEGPGEDEDLQGRPFVGRAGKKLDQMLEAIGLSRNTNCFIANVVKCRPPFNRDPQPEEAAACAHFLEKQIKLLNPQFILAVGRVSAKALLRTEASLGSMRGSIRELQIGGKTIPLVVTYHPAALLRSDDYRRPAWEDLKMLKTALDGSRA
jgi:DNA polymerase